MAVEDRTGQCRTCGGPAYRIPNRLPGTADQWVHRRTSDWLVNPHDVDPEPADGGPS